MRSSGEKKRQREDTQVPPTIRNVMRFPSIYSVSELGRSPRPFQLRSATWSRT